MLNCEECLLVLHVRPVTRGSVRDDSQAFVVSRCFFVWKSLRFGSKRLERVGDLAALKEFWTRGHKRVMGLNYEARNISVVSSDYAEWKPDIILCFMYHAAI